MLAINEQVIAGKIYLVRNQKVMLDKDLAELYGVETKVLKQAVKRNLDRFPEDFMFEMNIKESENLRSQFVTSSWGGTRYQPFCFTEQGVAMLSSVLGSDRAIKVNIQIIRLFIKMRGLLLSNKEILLMLQHMEGQVTRHDNEIQMIFNALKQ